MTRPVRQFPRLVVLALLVGVTLSLPALPPAAATRSAIVPPGWTPLPTGTEMLGEVYGVPGALAGSLWVSADSLTYRSDDGGLTWAPMPGEPVWPRRVAASPRQPGLLFAPKDAGEVWRSRDGGLTWTRLTLPKGTARYFNLREGPAVGLDGAVWVLTEYLNGLSAYSQLLVSRDDGETWTAVGPQIDTYARLILSPVDPARVWISDGQDAFRTDDGGLTWTSGLPELTVNALADPFARSTLYAIDEDRLLRSDDAGQSFQRVGSVGPDGQLGGEVVADGTRPGRLYRLNAHRELYTTGDAGQTWRVYPRPPVAGDASLTSVASPPGTGGAVFVGTSEGLFLTADDGATWQLASGFNSRPLRQVLGFGDRLLALGVSGNGGWSAAAAGSGWTFEPLPDGTPRSEWVQDPRQPRRLFAAGELGRISRSEDGGRSWTTLQTNLDPGLIQYTLALDPANSDRLWLGGAKRSDNQSYVTVLWRSDDAGQSWQPITAESGPRDFVRGLAFDPNTPGRLYAAGEKLFRTDDSGQTWRDFAVPSRPEIGNHWLVSARVDPADPNTIWAGTVASGLYVTHDAGEAWSWEPAIRADAAVRLIPHPANPRLFYAVAFSGATLQTRYNAPTFRASLHRTADGGVTWSDITGPHANTALRFGQLFVSIPLGQPNRLYVSGDGGAWVREEPAGG